MDSIERVQSDLVRLLKNEGAALIGFGDMSGVDHCEFHAGISVAVPLPVSTICDLMVAPTVEYSMLYDSLNNDLNRIVKAGETFIRSHGYRAYARSTDVVIVDADNDSGLPHKTVAVRAGLGWIGKNNLLVTREYGSAVRISTILTDAPFKTADTVYQSRCGKCRLCVDACPGNALKGANWEPGMSRERMVDVDACFKTQLRVMETATGISTDLCGKCFAVCAWTRKYISQELKR